LKVSAYTTLLFGLVLGAPACGSDDEKNGASGGAGDACDPPGNGACDGALACDPLASGEGYVCGAPVNIRGTVGDALSGEPVEGAQVIVLSADGAPASDVATTDADGHYSLDVSALREADGSVADSAQWTLIGSAQGYQIFPSGPRPAVPISASQIEEDGIDAANTLVTLLPLVAGGERQISGTILGANPGGTLVVAEGGAVPAPYAIADSNGDFTIFNVPSGQYTVVGYKGGQPLHAGISDTTDASQDGLRLDSADTELCSVSGSVNIVNAAGGLTTSVVLVPLSVFDPVLERGPIPLGLRAPGLPERPTISGPFMIEGVPKGEYVVLAAFENDQLVRDPDESIAGTQLQTVRVEAGDAEQVDESFKITEHLAVIAPGADAPEEVSGTPVFRWADDSSEDRYELELYTAMGELVWEDRDIPGVNGGHEVDLTYGGPSLVDGMVYQFRVASYRDKNGTTAISASEDLRGVFTYRE
jgi:hypothetical protein